MALRQSLPFPSSIQEPSGLRIAKSWDLSLQRQPTTISRSFYPCFQS